MKWSGEEFYCNLGIVVEEGCGTEALSLAHSSSL